MLRLGSCVWLSALFLKSCFVEPFYGTICLYNRERREKLSEDFYFHIIPTEIQDVSHTRPILTNFLGYDLFILNISNQRRISYWQLLFPFIQIPGQNYLWSSHNFLLRRAVCFSLSVNPVGEACYRRRRSYSFCLFS
jgi:hypothetical protein